MAPCRSTGPAHLSSVHDSEVQRLGFRLFESVMRFRVFRFGVPSRPMGKRTDKYVPKHKLVGLGFLDFIGSL